VFLDFINPASKYLMPILFASRRDYVSRKPAARWPEREGDLPSFVRKNEPDKCPARLTLLAV
jgi:hypothetical protein